MAIKDIMMMEDNILKKQIFKINEKSENNKNDLEKCIELEKYNQCKIYIQKIGTTDFLTANIKEVDNDEFTVSYTEISEGKRVNLQHSFPYTVLTKKFHLFRSPLLSRTKNVLKNSSNPFFDE